MLKHWSKTRVQSHERNQGLSPEIRILSAAEGILDDYSIKNPKFAISDLFRQKELDDFCKFCNIETVMPVGPSVINNYSSWLYKVKDGVTWVYVATSSPNPDEQSSFPVLRDWKKPNCRLFRFISIVAHEIGHLRLKHQFLAVGKAKPERIFPSMDHIEEWEAWVFSGFLTSFLLAEYARETKDGTGIDKAPHLLGTSPLADGLTVPAVHRADRQG